MLKLNSTMLGTSQIKEMAAFYKEVFQKEADMQDGGWYGWQFGSVQLSIGEHSEVHGEAKEPQRIIMNFETDKVKEEFERIKKIDGAKVIKEPYGMTQDGEETSSNDSPFWIATFADPDGNYFQLMTPWDPSSATN